MAWAKLAKQRFHHCEILSKQTNPAPFWVSSKLIGVSKCLEIYQRCYLMLPDPLILFKRDRLSLGRVLLMLNGHVGCKPYRCWGSSRHHHFQNDHGWADYPPRCCWSAVAISSSKAKCFWRDLIGRQLSTSVFNWNARGKDWQVKCCGCVLHCTQSRI